MNPNTSDRAAQSPANDFAAEANAPRPPRLLPPWLAEIEERLRSRPGFFESLTPEQRAFLDAYDGPEVLGPPPPPPMKRRPRRRGET